MASTHLQLGQLSFVAYSILQENQYLGVPHADVVAMPARLQDLLGYSDSVDFVRGSDLLREEVKEGRGLGAAVNRAAEPHGQLMRSLMPRL